MNKAYIPIFLAGTLLSAGAFADGWGHGNHWKAQKHHRSAPVVGYYYPAPLVVYQPAPVVIRERVVIREQPTYYYEAPPRYYEERPAAYGGGNRIMGQTLGAIAGGALGNQVGQGNGRIAATAIGAVVGSVLGGSAAGY